MTGTLFELAFYLAAPVWLLLIFAPAWGPTARVAASPLTVVPVLAVYLAMSLPVLPELWAAVSGPDIDVFRAVSYTPPTPPTKKKAQPPANPPPLQKQRTTD
ncbi:abscisic acid-deficient protein Aba4 family protein, partial [Streptomyces alfalfae]